MEYTDLNQYYKRMAADLTLLMALGLLAIGIASPLLNGWQALFLKFTSPFVLTVYDFNLIIYPGALLLLWHRFRERAFPLLMVLWASNEWIYASGVVAACAPHGQFAAINPLQWLIYFITISAAALLTLRHYKSQLRFSWMLLIPLAYTVIWVNAGFVQIDPTCAYQLPIGHSLTGIWWNLGFQVSMLLGILPTLLKLKVN